MEIFQSTRVFPDDGGERIRLLTVYDTLAEDVAREEEVEDVDLSVAVDDVRFGDTRIRSGTDAEAGSPSKKTNCPRSRLRGLNLDFAFSRRSFLKCPSNASRFSFLSKVRPFCLNARGRFS